MRYRLVLLAAALVFKLGAAQAQVLRLPSPLPGHGAESLRLPELALPGGVVAAPAAAPIPTVQAAAAYPPLVVPVHRFGQPLPAVALPEAPRRDLTGVSAFPTYNSYQNWPEAQRKYTLPDAWVEPLPLQLLRSLLGR